MENPENQIFLTSSTLSRVLSFSHKMALLSWRILPASLPSFLSFLGYCYYRNNVFSANAERARLALQRMRRSSAILVLPPSPRGILRKIHPRPFLSLRMALLLYNNLPVQPGVTGFVLERIVENFHDERLARRLPP